MILLVIFKLLLFASCNSAQEQNEDIVLPPNRMNEGTAFFVSYNYDDNVINAIKKADAVAHIKIGNWVGEVGENGVGSTYFEAEVMNVFKGNLPQKIRFTQSGYSGGNLNDFPLYTYGNELLIFMREYQKDCYSSMYSKETAFDVITAPDGEIYVVDTSVNSVFRNIKNELKNHTDNLLLTSQLIKTKKDNDPFWKEYNTVRIYRVFKFEDVLEYVSSNN